jgi:hypothetical protein
MPAAAERGRAAVCNPAQDRHGRRLPGARVSKEWRLEPQITIGLLTDQARFPLVITASEGNKAETKQGFHSFFTAQFRVWSSLAHALRRTFPWGTPAQ